MHIIQMYPSLNSILQCPAAYVPLDPASPPLCTMIKMNKCRLNFCLIQNELLNVGLLLYYIILYY